MNGCRCLTGVVLVAGIWAGGCTSGLRSQMRQMQSQGDRLGRAIEARDQPAAAASVREIENASALVKQAYPRYRDIELANTMASILDPAIRPVARDVSAADWPAAGRSYLTLIESCNRCHAATGNERVVARAIGGPR